MADSPTNNDLTIQYKLLYTKCTMPAWVFRGGRHYYKIVIKNKRKYKENYLSYIYSIFLLPPPLSVLPALLAFPFLFSFSSTYKSSHLLLSSCSSASCGQSAPSYPSRRSSPSLLLLPSLHPRADAASLWPSGAASYAGWGPSCGTVLQRFSFHQSFEHQHNLPQTQALPKEP